MFALILHIVLFLYEKRQNRKEEIANMTKIWEPFLIVVPNLLGLIFYKISYGLGYGIHIDGEKSTRLSSFILMTYAAVIPLAMISRSKKCKRFVMKKISIPFSICRNYT